MAHQTDEYVSQERIRQSVAIYESLIRDWCRLTNCVTYIRLITLSSAEVDARAAW